MCIFLISYTWDACSGYSVMWRFGVVLRALWQAAGGSFTNQGYDVLRSMSVGGILESAVKDNVLG